MDEIVSDVARPDVQFIVPRISMLTLLAMVMAFAAWGLGGWAAKAEPGCRGIRYDILTPALASTPYVVLDVGGRKGPWLVDFGSTISSVYAASRNASDHRPSFEFGFPGVGAGLRWLPVVEGGHHRSGIGAPIGTLGTDIMKTVTTEIHFEDGADPHMIFLDPTCHRDARAQEGYVRFRQANFFSSNPETHVTNLPNVPVVSIELEERSTDRLRHRLADPKRSPRTWAQIDTGYADTYWPYSIDINEPYLTLLKDAVPSLTLAGLVSISGCGREDTVREVYVAPGWRLSVVPDIPQRPIPFNSFHLIVKPRTTECGGIGPMLVPAAQLGASFLRAFGTTLIMPARAEVWIKPPAG